jgi:hypothetical protein
MHVLFQFKHGLFNLPFLFGIFITNKMKRLGRTHNWMYHNQNSNMDYHQPIVYAHSKVHVIVVGGGIRR